MEIDDVYYVDSSQLSNASHPGVIRTNGQARPVGVIQRQPQRFPPAPYQYPGPGSFFGPNFAGYPLNPAYVLPPMQTTLQPTSNLATILGGFGDVGTLANMVAQVVGAFLPLPDAPTPQDSHSESGDQALNAAINSSNLIRYQSALASYARRDQQILTLGSILEKLFRRPGVA